MRAYFWVVLVSFLPGSFSKVQELKVDVDFTGDDVLQIYSPDVQHCQLACTQHHSCLFFTFVRSDWSKDNRQFYCYLKYTDSGLPSKVINLKGVTSGFSLHSNDQTDSCLSSVYQDIDFTGSDYHQLIANTYDDCQKQCTHNPNCKFFSFTTDKFPDVKRRNQCFLKFSWTLPLPPEIHDQPGVTSGFSDSVFKAEGALTECPEEILANKDYPGNDIESLPAVSPEQCHFLCSTHPRCTHFSYTSSKFTTSNDWFKMRCFLKHVEDVDQLVPKILQEVYSGFPTSCDLSTAWAKRDYAYIDFNGSDTHYILTDTSEVCRQKCTEDPYCQFYTYALTSFHDINSRQRCYMKQVIILPKPEKVVSMLGVVSGFSLWNCNPDHKAHQIIRRIVQGIFKEAHIDRDAYGLNQLD